jgi:ABC-type transport system substrate-binding protein
MLDYLRFKYRRQARRLRRDIRIWRRWSANYIDRHIWGKWHQLGTNRRFLLVWWTIFAVALIGLTSQYTELLHYNRIIISEAGGSYTEASMGDLQVLNPILPGSNIEMSANRLIFSGLTQYNSDRKLVPDLATKWEISSDGKVYTFHLRKGVKWQDGVPFSSTDVAFTLAAIQNPDSR